MLLILTANWAVAGRFAFTPGGENFLFGRLVETGIAKRYLADHCPNRKLRVCAWRKQLPDDGDFWLWDAKSPLWRMGGWDKFAGEARYIVIDSVWEYAALHARVALGGAAEQFFMLKTGDGITGWTWHTHGMLKKYAPASYPAFLAARQQRAGFNFGRVSALHVPLALAAIFGLPMTVLLGRRRGVRPPAAAFALFVLIALGGNAIICGVLSNPHDRYQSRLIWLAPLALAVALGTLRRPARLPEGPYFRRAGTQSSALGQAA